MGLSTSLNTAIGGLNATQLGIGVVSQNVANAGTTGYVRRAVSTVEDYSGRNAGVQNTQVQRLLDKIVQHQLWQEASGAAYTSTRANSLSNLDKLYGAPGSSTALDTIYNKFTSSLQALQNDPSNYNLRTNVLDAASGLARQLNTLSAGVQTLRSQAESSIANGVTKVNELLGALTDVNASIVSRPNDNSTAELRDQRDRILSELSQYVDIKTTEDARGGISVITGSGTQLFDGQPTVRFSFDEHVGLSADDQWTTNPATRGVGTIRMLDSSGNASDAITNKVFRSGEIAANIELRDKTLVQAQAQLDEIAAQMSRALSEQQIDATLTPGPASQADLAFDLSNLARGDTLTFDYQATAGGAKQRLTFVNVATGTTLPASAMGDANNRVIAVDFSAGPAAVQTAIQNALNTAAGAGGFTATYTGTTLSIVDDGAAGTREVVGLTARPTSTTLSSAGGPAELPFFVDGLAGTPFTGSYEGGSQTVGFASRIAVNPALIADRSLLVVHDSAAPTAEGDDTRPQLMLERLTNSQRAFTNAVGLDGNNASQNTTIANYVQRVVSSQGQAVEAAKRLDEGQQVALASIQSRFQETSQVNVDQEMSLLIELQTAYAANARIISTVKEMMDVLMRV